jgi:hypothetical protein
VADDQRHDGGEIRQNDKELIRQARIRRMQIATNRDDLYFKADYDISTDSLLRKLPIGRHMKLSTPCYAATLLFAI